MSESDFGLISWQQVFFFKFPIPRHASVFASASITRIVTRVPTASSGRLRVCRKKLFIKDMEKKIVKIREVCVFVVKTLDPDAVEKLTESWPNLIFLCLFHVRCRCARGRRRSTPYQRPYWRTRWRRQLRYLCVIFVLLRSAAGRIRRKIPCCRAAHCLATLAFAPLVFVYSPPRTWFYYIY